MNPRKLIILCVVLGLLAAAAAVKQTAARRQATRDARTSSAPVRLAQGVDPSLVNRLAVRRESGSAPVTIVVERSVADGAWTLPSHHGLRVRGGQVDAFLKDLHALRGEMRSDDPSALGDFLLEDRQGVHVEAFDATGSLLGHWVISPLRAGPADIFARTSASAQVYRASPDLLGRLGVFKAEDAPDYKYFADMKVIPYALQEMERIELFFAGGGSVSLVRSGPSGVWEIEGQPGKADKSKVSSLLVQLVNLHAREVFASEAWRQGRMLLKVRRKGEPAAQSEVWIGPTDQNTGACLLKVLPEQRVWQVQEADVKGLLEYRSAADLELAAA